MVRINDAKSNRGFTLIELLVVVAIVTVLASLLFPVFAQVREQGRKTVCASNLKQIGTALLQYAEDNAGILPPKNANFYFKPSIQPYLRSEQIFECPSDATGWNNTYYKIGASSYSMNYSSSCSQHHPPHSTRGIESLGLSSIGLPARVPLILETSGMLGMSWHDRDLGIKSNQRSNVCFIDGHVKYIKMYLAPPDSTGFIDFPHHYEPPGTTTGTSAYEYQWNANS